MRIFTKMALVILMSSMTSAFAQKQDFQVKWDYSAQYNGKDSLGLQLTLINKGSSNLELKNYSLWFNSMYPIQEGSFGNYNIHNRNGNLYSIDFDGGTILAQDSLRIEYQSPYPIAHSSLVPNGFYLQHNIDNKNIIPINDPIIAPLKISATEQNQFLTNLYEKTALRKGEGNQLILPTPYAMKEGKGNLRLSVSVGYYVDDAFKTDLSMWNAFADQLSQIKFTNADVRSARFKVLFDEGMGEEEYKLKINANGIEIKGGKPSGIFYALQSIKSLLTADQLLGIGNVNLPYVEVHDKPRYSYRGLMIDIARNFKDKEVILKYLDLMAQYKLNKLHLHLIDDEGWRLEIPTLPELTEIGSVRSPYFKDGHSLQPAYGSGVSETKGHYLSRADFLEILNYASARYITVIPEIETPGHARAAIKSMEHRFMRLMAQGKQKEAEEFLLYEAEDKSKYSSAQYWDDNVMNPALPSVYRFLDVVITDIQKMYSDAGLTLKTISLGGDEVPAGSWENSPKVKELMNREGFKTVYEVWPYYISKIQALCESKGLEMAGWEEIGMVNKGDGMVVNDKLADKGMLLDVWNNVIGGGQEDLAYKLANAGYKTIFASCANYYLDMVWDKDFREPGLKWASISDLYQSFALLPEAFFANMKYTDAGAKLDPKYISQKTRLTEQGKSNLIGLKAALWQETVLSADRMDYMLLPRLFALAERAWRPAHHWEDDSRFDKREFDNTYTAFIRKVGIQELPKLDKLAGGFQYRLPSVGVKAQGNKLLANIEYPGFVIHYTTDNSEPTLHSLVFPKQGIKVTKGQRIKLAAISKNGRVGRVSEYIQE
ncbi:family 20 glycosylhydrolase [Sphingobacterium sp. DK4209]|uniref:beta-N-acetylhexosaminidase n=1 Tax=Sphingobacterium zhuxiongii TaxID=2662364 RepID=A0A5Q0QC58_9SPHI|nr:MULTISPECIES: family 20 glycosylhydrolase [unclassified Sphingobacterium]MVZ65644.1 family 20 glycosylhydrolase [Sphingobacterium sp. DK4209]QGA27767.1 family 20 glycosylhydrolase [Sphingobacterium sp. dk4302]